MLDPDIQEIPSPLAPPLSEQPSAKPSKPVVVTIASLDQGDALTLAFEQLRKMSVPRQNLLIGHLMALLQMHPADFAVVALHVQPYLSDDQVAVLCGKSKRQLRRYNEFQKIKPHVTEAKDRLRRRSYKPPEIGD